VINTSLIHQVLIYKDAQQFLTAVVPFIRGGLDRGEHVLAVATEANCALLRDEFGNAAGDLQFADPSHWYEAPGRTLASYHRYLQERRDGHERVRVIGEPVWSGWDQLQLAGWKRFEAIINIAFAIVPASLICSYDERTVSPGVIADARRTHPELSGGEKSEDYIDPAGFCSEMQLTLEPPPKGGYVALRFDGDPAPVRRFVVAQAARLGLPAARIDDLVLAANEVATNAIRHGAGHGQVRVWRDPRYVLCEVFDSGSAPDGLGSYVPPNPDSEGGHGLWITRQLCDLVEIRTMPAGTTVRMYLRHS
jgi:anti-sigma regulatory factor (Ser/Thr protein kinase)